MSLKRNNDCYVKDPFFPKNGFLVFGKGLSFQCLKLEFHALKPFVEKPTIWKPRSDRATGWFVAEVFF